MEIKIVGEVRFQTYSLPVYGDLDDPMFLVKDVAETLHISKGDMFGILRAISPERKLKASISFNGEIKEANFITEAGFYDILSQSQLPTALMWRHIITDQLVSARKEAGLNIIEQFDEWDHIADTLYYDEETGLVMRSVTVAGGDVEQIPYELGG